MSMLNRFFSCEYEGQGEVFEGLMVDLRDKYVITSNRESGFGRYDIMLEPKNPQQYETQLIEHGIPKERIRRYGFAFRGKEVLIG